MPTIPVFLLPDRLYDLTLDDGWVEADIRREAVRGTAHRYSGSGGYRLIDIGYGYLPNPARPMPDAFINDWEKYRKQTFIRHDLPVTSEEVDLIVSLFPE